MRLVEFDSHRVGVVNGDDVFDVSSVLGPWAGTPYAMTELIARWDECVDAVREAAANAVPLPLRNVRLGPPLPRPRQVLAAPLNYAHHVEEMVGSHQAPVSLQADHNARNLGFFVKASGSISGPADPVELPPIDGRSFHHEIELGVVIGRQARAIAPEQARAHIFGYVVLLDITMRVDRDHEEERTMRKSFETFTPIGPWIVTADEIEDPSALELSLNVNGDARQRANTADLIVGIDELVSSASHVLTLHPGDIYATGTPDGVGPLQPGDRIDACISSVGHMSLPVQRRPW
jgi:2-keto-4-pentenoate hydratase/2-oxohepta-3-ene-1,7-dioic acid hydratase in catechol pathway